MSRLRPSDPLSVEGVSFVFETLSAAPHAAAPVGERLRILALFSLPPVGSPLNLRRERHMLRDLVRRLAGTHGLEVDLHVLQYGVTRDSLKDVLEQEEGWDIIHFSGHGQPGALLLEQPDGRPDEVSSTDLARLLRQAGGRVKLVTLSACLSAAASVEQTLGWLGIAPEAAAHRDAPPSPAAEQVKAAPTVSRALTEALDCAVLAMRYAVEDEFATLLARELYDRLFRQKQSLPVATRLALASAAGGKDGLSAFGALSSAAPALCGARAADLTLVPPARKKGIRPDTLLAYVPKQPAHFVGRVGAMTRASAALAEKSSRSGILFHGMAGAGKTSCAVELVYHHASAARFRAFVWYSAPEQGKDIVLALRDFALTVEQRLELPMLHVIDRIDALRTWLPTLVEVLENNAVLLVLDNLESLLTETGQWRDERWGMLVEALLTPGGLSRTLLTSRIRLVGLPGSAEVIAVHALPLDEALLLVRELPNLRRLLDGKGAGVSEAAGRQLVRRVLRLVQGHPKLIELAEALAAEPAKLAAQLDKADAAQTAGAGELDAFFARGETQFNAASFTTSLGGWTRSIASGLPEAARVFFHFLCAIEESDRLGWIIEANWSDVWQRLGHPAPAPEAAAMLTPLMAAALVDRQAIGEEKTGAFAVLIHAGVAEASRAEAGATLQAAVDHELAATWRTLSAQASEAHGREPWAGPALARAGLAAFPYLARLGEWEDASKMLEQVLRQDRSPDTIASMLPLAQRIAAATAGTDRELVHRGLVAEVLLADGRIDEAEALLREVIGRAAERSEFALASSASGNLANLLRDTGRLTLALQVVEHKSEYTRLAGHGPWTQLANEGRRLQILNALGKATEVLIWVTELLTRVQNMPDPPEDNDWSINTYNTRESVLDIGRSAASALGEWQRALDLNAEQLQLEQDRGATPLEHARTRFNDYGPLLRLQRYDEADQLLHHCREIFEQANAVAELGAVFSALADLKSHLGQYDAAKRFEEAALRYRYTVVGPAAVAISHFNLANYLSRLGSDPHDVLEHRLAATLLSFATGSGKLADAVSAIGPGG